MNVTFYNATFNRRQVVKALPSGTLFSNISLKDPCDTHDPVIRLGHAASNMQFNYAYIPDFGRYYYVDPPEIDGKEDILYLHVDTIMSQSNAIKNSNVIATRSNFGNKQLHDNMVAEQADEFIEYRKLGDSLTGDSYILILGG